jgi:Uma2 family endonuclease
MSLWQDHAMAPTVDDYADTVAVPSVAIEFPLELPIPEGFDPERLETWPPVEGALEYVEGKLLYLPPGGDRQILTRGDVVGVLHAWRKTRTEFIVGGNEAGISLAGDVRGADAAVWRTSDLGPLTGGVLHVAPLLTVEVAGRYDREKKLRAKARWYFQRGVEVVWLLFPAQARVIVLDAAGGEASHGRGERIPERELLPGLSPAVDELFEQVLR